MTRLRSQKPESKAKAHDHLLQTDLVLDIAVFHVQREVAMDQRLDASQKSSNLDGRRSANAKLSVSRSWMRA